LGTGGTAYVGTYTSSANPSAALVPNLSPVDPTETFQTTPVTPELLALGAVGGGPANQPALTDQSIAPLVQEAISLWGAAGVDVSRLDGLRVMVADLPGDLLGLTTNGLIQIDANAASLGWYIDPTTGTDGAFAAGPGGASLAVAGGPAWGHIDLLTVLSHEIGNALGVPEVHGAPLDVMEFEVGPSVRRFELPDSFSQSVSSPAPLAATNLDGTNQALAAAAPAGFGDTMSGHGTGTGPQAAELSASEPAGGPLSETATAQEPAARGALSAATVTAGSVQGRQVNPIEAGLPMATVIAAALPQGLSPEALGLISPIQAAITTMPVFAGLETQEPAWSLVAATSSPVAAEKPDLLPAIARENPNALIPTRPRMSPVSDSVLDELAADSVLWQTYAGDGNIMIPLLSPDAVPGAAVSTDSTSPQVRRRSPGAFAERIVAIGLAAGLWGGSSLARARKRRSGGLSLGRKPTKP
jgi:hypothetical protein